MTSLREALVRRISAALAGAKRFWRRVNQTFRRSVYTGVSLALITLYAAIVDPIVHNIWVGLIVIPLIFILTAVSLLVADILGQLGSERSPLLSPLPEHQYMTDEREQALRLPALSESHDAGHPWWDDEFTQWFEHLFAFWWKCIPVSAASIVYRCGGDTLTPRDYAGVPSDPIAQPKKKKAAIIDVSSLGSDHPREIRYRPIDWETVQFAERNPDSFRKDNPHISAFGFPLSVTQTPYPSLLVVHSIVETADGWVLFSLRGRRNVDFFPKSWSATFEEQVEVGETLRDETVEDTALRGLREEYGVSDVSSTNCLLIGREAVAIKPEAMVTRLILNGAIVVCMLLGCTIAEVWDSLRHPARIRDPEEHVGWMACRFEGIDDVRVMLKQNPRMFGPQLAEKRRNSRVAVKVLKAPADKGYEGQGFWHPTARARLWLWAQLAVEEHRLARSLRHR